MTKKPFPNGRSYPLGQVNGEFIVNIDSVTVLCSGERRMLTSIDEFKWFESFSSSLYLSDI